MEALLASDEFDTVYSLLPVWRSSEPKPAKFIDGLPAAEDENTICIFHDSYHVAEKHSFRGLVIQVHQPTVLFTGFMEKYGKRFFVTYNRAVRSTADGVHQRIIDRSGRDHVENLAGPSVPDVSDGNNFDENIILFSASGVLSALRHRTFFGSLFSWCAQKLEEDHRKEVHFLAAAPNDNARAEFFQSPETQCLLSVRDRVVLHPALSWASVLDLYAKTKVVVSTLATGGSPPEAASFGIPVIGPANSPIAQFPEFLAAPCLSPEYFSLLDRLYYDRAFYVETGNAYRNFVRTHYTYAAYVKNLVRIFQEREMI